MPQQRDFSDPTPPQRLVDDTANFRAFREALEDATASRDVPARPPRRADRGSRLLQFLHLKP
jgi:hypothetical protein